MHPLDSLLSLIAPHECVGCHSEGRAICQECSDSLEPLPSLCYACGKASRNMRPCPDCVGQNKPQHVWIFAEYSGLAKSLVHTLKFDCTRLAAIEMAELMDGCLPYFANPPLVGYVPTAPARHRARGFDHAQLVAKELARLRGWHYTTFLARRKHNRQLGADREQRKRQLKDTFRIVNHSLVKNRHILLVDDVVTTGATLEVCTKELKKAGAAQIDAAVFARTPKNS